MLFRSILLRPATPTPIAGFPAEQAGTLLWGSPSLRNVSVAELLPLLPAEGAFAETAIILCSGGAFHFLMIEKEGRAVGR